MKKILTILLLICSFAFIDSVSAYEDFYENPNGVKLSKDELKFVQTLFYEGFEKILTFEDYENIFSHGLTPQSKIEKSQSNIFIPAATSHTTMNKSITIGKACTTSNCTVTIVVNWINQPNTRSYDVIGAYFSGTTNITPPYTRVESSTGVKAYSNNVIDKNGVGCSVKLPDVGDAINVVQYFYVNVGGTVYASYQHAMSNISLENSKKYTFSNNGYGGVFNFQPSVSKYYDQMLGVYITL